MTPCLSCKRLVVARQIKGEKGRQCRVEGRTNADTDTWVLLQQTYEAVLPCIPCLTEISGMDADQWRQVKLNHSHLTNVMQPRLRQHLDRRHKMKASGSEPLTMRKLGMDLLCRLLHHEGDEEATAIPGPSTSSPLPAPFVGEVRVNMEHCEQD